MTGDTALDLDRRDRGQLQHLVRPGRARDRRRAARRRGRRELGFGAPHPVRPADGGVSQVTNGDGSAPGGFADDVELASASFGQGETFVTPLQMALVAVDRRERRRADEAPRRLGADGRRPGRADDRPRGAGAACSTRRGRAGDPGGDAGGGRGRHRPPVHGRRQGPGRADGRQVRHGGAGRAAASRTRGSSASRRSRTRRSRSPCSSSAAAAEASARRPSRAT